MTPIQQNVISEIVEKQDASNTLKTPEPFFFIGKDVIPSCPPDADMRDFIDPLIEGMFWTKALVMSRDSRMQMSWLLQS